MNRIYFILLLLCGFATANLSAQSFGLRVGVIGTDATVDLDDAEVDTDGETNLMLGLFVNVPIGTKSFSIQPEINYLNRGYSGEINVAGQSIERTVAYLDLGALARLNFGSDEGLGFYVGAGPIFSYAVSGTQTDILGEEDIDFDSERLNRGELQFAVAGGVSLGSNLRFFAEVRYNGSFTDQSDLDDSEIRQRSLGVNGGVMIPFGN